MRASSSIPGLRFQSTPPIRRATRDQMDTAFDGPISIHAPHTEGDKFFVCSP